MARTSGTRLQAVGEVDQGLLGEEMPEPNVSSGSRAQEALTELLFTSLKALSQRTLVALASLVDLALMGSVFAALLMVIAAPTVPQLVGLAGYAVFILTAIFMRRR